MANSVIGYQNKRERLAKAREKLSNDPGEYQYTIIFKKGDRRGVLAVWERRIEWTVYEDPMFSAHVDWKDEDCEFLNRLENTTLLHVLSCIIDNGWEEKSRYMH